MDDWNFLNDEAKAKQAKKLTPAERAALFYFTDYQTPAEIADQCIPVEKVPPTDRAERRKWNLQRDARNAYCQQLIDACDVGDISHVKTKQEESVYPIPGGGERVPPTRNSYLLWDGPSNEWLSEFNNRPSPQKKKVTNYDYSIHKDDFKGYLQNIGKWPVDGLLANWWAGDVVSQAPDKNKQAIDVRNVGEMEASTAETVQGGDIYSRRKTHFETLSIDLDQHPEEIYSRVIETKNEAWYKQKQAKGATPAFIEFAAFDRDFLQKYYKDVGKERIKGARPKAK